MKNVGLCWVAEKSILPSPEDLQRQPGSSLSVSVPAM